MPWIDERIRVCEGRIERLRRELSAAEDAIRALQQGLRAANMMRGQGGGGGAGVYTATIEENLAASASITGQTVYLRVNGTLTQMSTNATLWNELTSLYATSGSGVQVLLSPNADGSYTVIAAAC